MVKWLIKNGKNVNATNSANWTALHYVAQNGKFKLKSKNMTKISSLIFVFILHRKWRDC